MSQDVDELNTKTFVPVGSIVREIWGTPDIILFIFAGAAAEFALNRQADWLYFTGRLPADPIARLFSTVRYARGIIFRDQEAAMQSIGRINQIHHVVEKGRGRNIPEESYKDVLYLLIHYSIAAFELLERPLDPAEKDDVVEVFAQMGRNMGLGALPRRHGDWKIAYRYHQAMNLQKTHWTVDLFERYREHLGAFRFFLLKEIQAMLAPQRVRQLLGMPRGNTGRWALQPYRILRRLGWNRWLLRQMVPGRFSKEFREIGG